jgi:demethylmenaquinone methyltransferase/2-methoxy-6-polyprenyl-1,4-benzoquinol methylase
MVRVLKPGGTLCILEFSRPTSFPMKQLFGLYFRRIMPAVGRWVSKDPAAYGYLPESVAAFPDGEAFLARMRTAGCTEAHAIRLTGGVASLYFGTAPAA